MIGRRIAFFRKLAGMSQSDLARRLYVTPSAIGMYEQGRRSPSNAMLVALARELHVTTDYLLTGEYPQECIPEDAQILRLMLELLRSDSPKTAGK